MNDMVNDKLKEQFDWYLANQEELVKQYNGKHLVIKDFKVADAYDDENTAYSQAIEKYSIGNFIIQLCTPGDEAYTRTIYPDCVEDILDQFYEENEEEEKVFDEAIENFRENGVYGIPYDEFDFDQNIKEDFFGNFTYKKHLGYVAVKEAIPSPIEGRRTFTIKQESINMLKEKQRVTSQMHFEETRDEEDSFVYLVWQVTEFEDCYHGYLLLPMKDGLYWLFYYNA